MGAQALSCAGHMAKIPEQALKERSALRACIRRHCADTCQRMRGRRLDSVVWLARLVMIPWSYFGLVTENQIPESPTLISLCFAYTSAQHMYIDTYYIFGEHVMSTYFRVPHLHASKQHIDKLWAASCD